MVSLGKSGIISKQHETNAGEPLWESKTIIVPKQEVAKTSQLYGMLFPSRRIRLIEENGLVKQIYYQPGLHFTGFNGWSDPHVAYRLNKDGIPVSIKPSQDKEPWRNIGTMTENFREMAPLVIREFSEIQENRDLSEMPVMLFGVATSNGERSGQGGGKPHVCVDEPTNAEQL